MNALITQEAGSAVAADTAKIAIAERRNQFRRQVDSLIKAMSSVQPSKFEGIPFQSEGWKASKELRSLIDFCKSAANNELYSFGCIRAQQFEAPVSRKKNSVNSYMQITIDHLKTLANLNDYNLLEPIEKSISQNKIDEAVAAFDQLLNKLGEQKNNE